MEKSRLKRINAPEGFLLSPIYKVIRKLGEGWEGEVYVIREKHTGIERVAKIFYPHRNRKNKAAIFYAKKLHKLRNCSILIKYLTQDTFSFKGHDLTYLVSEFVEGLPLNEFIKKQKGNRLHSFQGLHLIHALAKGIEDIHRLKEYHGDLHTENVIVQRHGLGFDLKLVDMYHWGKASAENVQHDVFCLIRLLYDSLGGLNHYSKQPRVIKNICCGLKRGLILRKFKTAGQLRAYLENLEWH